MASISIPNERKTKPTKPGISAIVRLELQELRRRYDTWRFTRYLINGRYGDAREFARTLRKPQIKEGIKKARIAIYEKNEKQIQTLGETRRR